MGVRHSMSAKKSVLPTLTQMRHTNVNLIDFSVYPSNFAFRLQDFFSLREQTWITNCQYLSALATLPIHFSCLHLGFIFPVLVFDRTKQIRKNDIFEIFFL